MFGRSCEAPGVVLGHVVDGEGEVRVGYSGGGGEEGAVDLCEDGGALVEHLREGVGGGGEDVQLGV